MPEISDEEAKELRFIKRQAIVDGWKAAAEYVAQETQDSTAQQLITFMNQHAVYGVPMPGGMVRDFYIDKPDTKKRTVCLVAMLQKDKDRLEKKDTRLRIIAGEGKEIARYTEGSNAIYLPDIAMTDKAKGLILLHELAHAKWHMNLGLDTETSEQEDELEEHEILIFESGLAIRLGGTKYKKWLKELTKRINKSYKDGDEQFQYKFTDEDDEFLKEIFNPKSEQEFRLWEYVSVVTAVESNP